jgi:hypothetical protein
MPNGEDGNAHTVARARPPRAICSSAGRPVALDRFPVTVGFRQVREPRLWADPVMAADDNDKKRNLPGNPALRDLVPHELNIRPNYDLKAIEFEVVDRDGRGFVITVYNQDMPDILLKSIRAWAQLGGYSKSPPTSSRGGQ